MKIGEVILNRKFCRTKKIHKYIEQVDTFNNYETIEECPHDSHFQGFEFEDHECELSCDDCTRTEASRWRFRKTTNEEEE